MRPSNRYAESGNAFFIVMIGVVLFAALMFTFSRGARQGGDNLSEKQARIAATELINIAQRLERTVSRLLLRGCSETELSFDGHGGLIKRTNETVYDMSNANSPADESCHVFSSAGGNMTPYLLPEDHVVDPSLPCATCSHARSMYVTSTRVTGHNRESGAAGTELVLWLGRVTKDLCVEINNQLGIPNPGGNPPEDPWACNGDQPFKGSFENCTDAVGDGVAALAGQNSFCVAYNTAGWTYVYMTVLIPR